MTFLFLQPIYVQFVSVKTIPTVIWIKALEFQVRRLQNIDHEFKLRQITWILIQIHVQTYKNLDTKTTEEYIDQKGVWENRHTKEEINCLEKWHTTLRTTIWNFFHGVYILDIGIIGKYVIIYLVLSIFWGKSLFNCWLCRLMIHE